MFVLVSSIIIMFELVLSIRTFRFDQFVKLVFDDMYLVLVTANCFYLFVDLLAKAYLVDLGCLFC